MKIRKIQTESRSQESYKKVTESYIKLQKLSYKKGKEKETSAGCRLTELSGWVKVSVPISISISITVSCEQFNSYSRSSVWAKCSIGSSAIMKTAWFESQILMRRLSWLFTISFGQRPRRGRWPMVPPYYCGLAENSASFRFYPFLPKFDKA